MNTWVSFSEWQEAIERELQKDIDLERTVYLNWSIRSIILNVLVKDSFLNINAIREKNLMQSINNKKQCYFESLKNNPSIVKYICEHNKQIMQRYAKR